MPPSSLVLEKGDVAECDAEKMQDVCGETR
jgi:hypothetical protein